MSDVIPAPQQARVPVRGGGTFPVHRIYCVGRNYADHAREMGSEVATSKAERGEPTLFAKPADAIVTGNADVPYPPAPMTCITNWNWWLRWAPTHPPACWHRRTPPR